MRTNCPVAKRIEFKVNSAKSSAKLDILWESLNWNWSRLSQQKEEVFNIAQRTSMELSERTKPRTVSFFYERTCQKFLFHSIYVRLCDFLAATVGVLTPKWGILENLVHTKLRSLIPNVRYFLLSSEHFRSISCCSQQICNKHKDIQTEQVRRKTSKCFWSHDMQVSAVKRGNSMSSIMPFLCFPGGQKQKINRFTNSEIISTKGDCFR